jgi:hypothetical protein
MSDERWIGKDLEESGRSLNEVLVRNLPGGTEKTMNIPSQDMRCLEQDLNRGSLEVYGYANPLLVIVIRES